MRVAVAALLSMALLSAAQSADVSIVLSDQEQADAMTATRAIDQCIGAAMLRSDLRVCRIVQDQMQVLANKIQSAPRPPAIPQSQE